MVVRVLAFGIIKDILGGVSSINIDLEQNATVGDLRNFLEINYSKLKELKSYMVAQDNVYAKISDIINFNSEIAIIPPVSGG